MFSDMRGESRQRPSPSNDTRKGEGRISSKVSNIICAYMAHMAQYVSYMLGLVCMRCIHICIPACMCPNAHRADTGALFPMVHLVLL
jgi:hypothetical protein